VALSPLRQASEAASRRERPREPSDPVRRDLQRAHENFRQGRARSRERLARRRGRIRDVRPQAVHPLSPNRARRAEVLGLDALRVKAMARGMGRSALRRSVVAAAFGELSRQSESQAAWAERTLIQADPFCPSCKRGSGCGSIHARLRLEKHGTCRRCGAEHDRDEHAATGACGKPPAALSLLWAASRT
jgi:transposase